MAAGTRRKKSNFDLGKNEKGAEAHKYLPDHNRQDCFLRFHKFKQQELSAEEYISKFDHFMLKCDLSEPKEHTIARFLDGLRPNIGMLFNYNPIGPILMSTSLCLKLKDNKWRLESILFDHCTSHIVPTD